MGAWQTFWAVFLIVSLILFAGLAVVVSIGAALDLRSMFRALRKEHQRQASHPEQETR